MKYETKQNILFFILLGLLVLIWVQILDVISVPTKWFGSQSLTYTVDKLTHLIKVSGNGIVIVSIIIGVLVIDYIKLKKKVRYLENHLTGVEKKDK
jgi:hypothetical protein